MDRETFFIITSTIFIILTLITIIFALTIIIIVVYNWKGQSRSITNLLTCNSSATLLYHSIATIIEISFFPRTCHMTTNFCKICGFIYFSSCTTRAYSYLIQSISRYFITICYKHRSLLTFRINWILILFNWTIGGIIATFMFTIPFAFQYESESRMCLLTSKVFLSSFIGVMIVFCIPFIIIILLYTLILHHTTRNQLNLNTFSTLRLKRNLKVFQNILIAVCIFAIGGIPYLISVIINLLNEVPWPLYTLSVLFISLSGTLESLTLFFTNTQVKTVFCTMIRCQPRENTNIIVREMNQLIVRTNQINGILLKPTSN